METSPSLEPVLGALLKRGLTLTLVNEGTALLAGPKERLDDASRKLLRDNRDALLRCIQERELAAAETELICANGCIQPTEAQDTPPAMLAAQSADEYTHTLTVMELVQAARANALLLAPVLLGPGRLLSDPNPFVRHVDGFLRCLRNLYGPDYTARNTAEDAMNDLSILAFWWKAYREEQGGETGSDKIAGQNRTENSPESLKSPESLESAFPEAADEELTLCI